MIELILQLGALQAALLGIMLWRKKPRSHPNIVLAILVLLFSISTFLHSTDALEYYLQYPHLIRVNWGIPLLFGPLIYLYTVLLTGQRNRITEGQLWHIAPYFINLILLTPFFIKSEEEKLQVLDYFTAVITAGTDGYFFYHNFILMLAAVLGLSYGYESLKTLLKYNEDLKSEYASIEKVKLEWLRLLIISFLVLSSIFAIAMILTFGERYPSVNYEVYYYLVLFIFIYGLSYKALNQPEIFRLNFTSEEVPIKKNNSTKTPRSIELTNFMKIDKPFLNGELTATLLANQLNVSRHELSQILNDEIGENFYDFINGYRVEEFKKKISSSSNDHLTILAVAYSSGFNSKTAFNTIFKKVEGMTPRQYKNTLNTHK